MADEATGSRAGGALARDAAITIVSRIGLAGLIFATDIVLARLLGPAAKGRFALVLLYSQLVALVLSWGMDQALAVMSGRDLGSARRGFANAIAWTAVIGGFGVILSAWAYGLGEPGRPAGPLVSVIPNLSESQFLFAALAVPGELFFAIALLGLLGRRLVAPYAAIRILRRLVLLILMVAVAALFRLSLGVVLVLNLVALAAAAAAITGTAWWGGFLSLQPSLVMLGEELGYGTRAVPGALAERLQFRADSFLVNVFEGVRSTGIYSVTSGLAETLWYIPNSLGIVMFSRAVDPTADAGRVAAVLTRTTLAITLLLAVPAAILGPALVRFAYGSTFADAGVALRYILPGIVAYSIVAVLTRYLSGRGRPGTTTAIMAIGLTANIAANLVLIPRIGINGAALASSISYCLTAAVTLVMFVRISGRSGLETLVLRPSDLRAAARLARSLISGVARRGRVAPATAPDGAGLAIELIVGEHDPGGEE